MLDDDIGSAYAALLAKVDDFVDGVGARRDEDLACEPGCNACCQVQLSVSPVEAEAVVAHLGALPAELREALRERAARLAMALEELGPREPEPQPSPCVMQEVDGRCAIYPARPLVCRSQGMALAYPTGFVPEEAVMASGGHAVDITWCPLNYTTSAPTGADVLDAETIDQVLAILNERHVAALGENSTTRVLLSVLCAAC